MKRLALLLALLALVAASSASANWTPLHVGSTGQRVKDAQWLLRGHNHFHLVTYGGRVNGYYGRRTAVATRHSKFWLGYPKKAISGRFGFQFYYYLSGKAKLPSQFRERRWARLTLYHGNTGQRVKDAQWLLGGHNRFKLRTYTGAVNGRYTVRTAKAAWWSKYLLGYPRPIYGTFGPKLKNILRGRVGLPADYRHRRLQRRSSPYLHSLSGFAAFARTTVGTAYRWGGTNPFVGGADCSGLIQYLYSRYWGKAIPRSTYTQVYGGQRLTRPTQTGDLIFYHGWPPGHVTMYLGNGLMIEDPHTGATVYVSHVRSGYVAVRRYLPTFLPGSFQSSSAGLSGLPWRTAVASCLLSLLLGILGAHALMRRIARRAAHEIGELADGIEERLEEK